MKNKFLIICLIGIGLITVASCKKKSSDSSTTTTPVASITATVAGTSYVSSSVYSNISSGIHLFSSLGGSTSKTLGFALSDVTKGTHPLSGGGDPTMSYTLNSNNYSSGFTPTGSIIITTNDGSTISGTFSGTLYNIMGSGDSVKVTNGVFSNLSIK